MAHPLESNLDRLLDHTYSTGYLQNGDLDLKPVEFAAHILSVVERHLGKGANGVAAQSFISNLHIGDLYLTVACARCSARAWNRFVVTYNKFINDTAFFVSPTPDAARELAANVLVEMFLPGRTGCSRIGSYEGRGSLKSWLRMIISNRVINEHALKWNTEQIESAAHIPDLDGITRMEASLRASRYENIIEDALNRACRNLAPRERLMLWMRYNDGLQFSQIARLLGVYPSSVTRHLERIQKKLRNNFLHILESDYSLEKSVIEECLDDLAENPYYSLLGIIKRLSQNDQ